MDNEPIYVTTSVHAHADAIDMAERISRKLDCPYIERRKRSLASLNNIAGCEQAIVVNNQHIELQTGDQRFYFHPSMAKVRLKTLEHGGYDPLKEVLNNSESLSAADEIRVLDCTLGLGADAIVMSYILGDKARITGLEHSPLIALIVQTGLQNYDDGDELLTKAMRRIQVLNADYRDFLPDTAEKSFEFVYFDPMFRSGIDKSMAINPLRMFACSDRLETDSLKQAERVASRRVIMKSRRQSREFARLGFSQLIGGSYAAVQYGIIDCQQ